MLLPDIRRVSGDWYTFQQDSAPAHRARGTVEFLQKEKCQSLFRGYCGLQIRQITILLMTIYYITAQYSVLSRLI